MTDLPDPVPAPRGQSRLLGHEHAVQVLDRAFRSGRLAHAWMLTGPRGVGKATLAYRFARIYLAGPQAGAEVNDPAHAVFRKVANGSHEDLTTVEPRQTKRAVTAQKVDDVREILAGLHRTSSSGRKVCLIDDADVTLSAHGENTLLKVLEEPPAGLIFLLVAQRPGGLLPTITSRCARLRLAPLADGLVVDGLRHLRPELDDATLQEIAALAMGSIGRALELATLDWAGGYARLLGSLAATGEAADLLAAGSLAAVLEREGQPQTARLLDIILRRAVTTACGRPPQRPLVADEIAGLGSIAARATPRQLLELAQDLGILAGRVETLNLDPLQALVQIVHGIRHPGAARHVSFA